MPKSDRTIAEFHAQAMLLGLTYDPRDHTIGRWLGEDGPDVELDADTLEPMDPMSNSNYMARCKLVSEGKKGAKDYDPTDRPDNGQTDEAPYLEGDQP